MCKLLNSITIRPDGMITSKQIKEDDLNSMQVEVGGYIELIYGDDNVQIYADEDGRSKELTYNRFANSISFSLIKGYRTFGLLGNVLIIFLNTEQKGKSGCDMNQAIYGFAKLGHGDKILGNRN